MCFVVGWFCVLCLEFFICLLVSFGVLSINLFCFVVVSLFHFALGSNDTIHKLYFHTCGA